MTEEAREYQQQVTGAPPGWVYRVRTGPGPNDKVDFDGFENGRLQEVKGPGYRALFNKIGDKFYFKGVNEMIEQATRQLNAVTETLIEWHFAEKEVADFMRDLFRDKGLRRIRVTHTPKTTKETAK